MLFSSNIFLYLFLPLVLVGCVATPRKYKNIFLLFASVLFYYYGSGYYVALLAFMMCFNYYIGNAIVSSEHRKRRILFAVGCATNVGILVYYKYLYFFAQQVNVLFPLHVDVSVFKVTFPLGISFCTFIAISYLFELYTRKIHTRVLFTDFGMFMSFFPHLIAGPIIRFTNIERDILAHRLSLDMFHDGISRFALGLGKKVLLANNVGMLADRMFGTPVAGLSCSQAWLGMVCYAFQIYYDFSGYSDMAIGLGKMFGFHFPENFNQPYRSSSITEFWRRWHMTLSFWLRDFLYIPLGGNRKGTLRTYGNLLIVFLVCGLWHGAAWTFIVWGLYHGLFLIIERILSARCNVDFRGALGVVYTFVVVCVGWVFFRAASLDGAVNYIGALFSFSGFSLEPIRIMRLENNISLENFVALALSAVFAFAPFGWRETLLAKSSVMSAVNSAAVLSVLVLSVLALSVSGYNPFIYSNF